MLQTSRKCCHFQESQKLQNLSHGLEQLIFMIWYLSFLNKYNKRNRDSASLSSEVIGLYIWKGLTLSTMDKIIRCSFKNVFKLQF